MIGTCLTCCELEGAEGPVLRSWVCAEVEAVEACEWLREWWVGVS